MRDDFLSIIRETEEWTARAQSAGWLNPAVADTLRTIEQATPADLFSDTLQRPLVVAFFGGTGVGKSSLLNRLAGEKIALVGIERPTSRTITLFLHNSVALTDLPPALPTDRCRIDRHHNPQYRDVVWIDMVDMDSTRTDNQELVFAWLPYIDLLVYVVSPERYRDDAGWQVLLHREQKHGWLFVLNHWDEGDPGQIEDLRTILTAAGFRQPLIFRTCCAPRQCENSDDFSGLEETIRAVVKNHGIRLLEQSGQRARMQELHQALQGALDCFGDTSTWERLRNEFTARLRAAQDDIIAGMAPAVHETAARLAIRAGESRPSLLRAALPHFSLTGNQGRNPATEENQGEKGTATPMSGDELDLLCKGMWDDWCQAKLMDVPTMMEIEAGRADVAAEPVCARVQAILQKAPGTINGFIRDGLRLSLAQPGSALRRNIRKCLKLCTILLPAAALGWITYAAITGYYRALNGGTPFLGIDFAIHSLLVFLLAWLVPYLAQAVLRPSTLAAARQGLNNGLQAGLASMLDECESGFALVERERDQLRTEAETLLGRISGLIASPIDHDSALLGQLRADSSNPPPVK